MNEKPKTGEDFGSLWKGVSRPVDPVRAPSESPRPAAVHGDAAHSHEPWKPDGAVPPVLAIRESKGGLLLADDPSLAAESLPVLNALRQFLETERRRTRRQIGWLVSVFAILLAAAVAGGFVVARVYWHRVQGDLAREHRRAETVSQSAQSAQKAVQNLAAATDKFQEDLQGQKSALERAQATINLRIKDGSQDLTYLKDVIDTLEIQNASLAYAVQDMRSNWTARARPLARVEEHTVAVSREPPPVSAPALAPEPPPPAEREPPVAPAAAAPETAVPVVVTPSNAYRAISFRLPMP